MIRIALLLIIAALPTKLCAATIYSHGKIVKLYASSGVLLSYRIFLDSEFTGGSCNHGFVYLSTTNVNYNALVALLTTAASTGKKVGVWANHDASGFCEIQDIEVGI